MGIKRIVDTSFWTDGKVDEFSPEDKYFMLYLLTNPFSTQLGIYEFSIKQVAFQMGYSMDAVRVLIDRFESKYGIIIYSAETNEIAIKNFLRHSIIKGGAPVRDCLIKEMKKVKNKSLIVRVFSHIKDSENLNETVKNIITEHEEKNGNLYYSNEKQNDNENDNENEVSYHDTGNESYNESFDAPKDTQSKPESKKKTVKHKHGEYQNVLLTENEYENLANSFGIALRDQAIKFLDEYIEEKGYKSKSHNLAIRRWVIDAVKKNPQSKPGNSNSSFDTDEMFNRALRRSYGRREPEMATPTEPPKTAAEDETIRKRMEALRKQISG